MSNLNRKITNRPPFGPIDSKARYYGCLKAEDVCGDTVDAANQSTPEFSNLARVSRA